MKLVLSIVSLFATPTQCQGPENPGSGCRMEQNQDQAKTHDVYFQVAIL